VPPADYWDTVKVQIVDTRTIEIIAKKAGKTIAHGSRCDFRGGKFADPNGERYDRGGYCHD
jgi:hypothetical protein